MIINRFYTLFTQNPRINSLCIIQLPLSKTVPFDKLQCFLHGIFQYMVIGFTGDVVWIVLD